MSPTITSPPPPLPPIITAKATIDAGATEPGTHVYSLANAQAYIHI